MKRSLSRLAALFLPLCLFAQPSSPKASFGEIWAYLNDGDEKALSGDLPISDIGYFGASLSDTCELVGVPNVARIADFKGRKHLVVNEIGSYARTHFAIDSSLPLKRALIDRIVSAAAPFDGVQIDFEAVLSRDAEAFYAFLAELRSRLSGKLFSLAVPAMVAEVPGSVWDYARLDGMADRIIVMAYDEHWSTSAPGSIASLDWSRKVAAYALSRIDPSRLVMGNPFYGRAWADKSLSKSYRYPSLQKLIADEKVKTIKREGEVPYFDYEKKVKVRVYFEDLRSMSARLGAYRELGVANVSFWCLGQEDKRIWSRLESTQGQLPAVPPGANPSAQTAAPAPSGLPAP